MGGLAGRECLLLRRQAQNSGIHANSGESALLAAQLFKRREKKRAVDPQRPAHADTVLRPGVGWIFDRGKGVGCVETAVAEKRENAAVEGIVARFRDHVHHAARRTAVLSLVATRQNLEFLHRLHGNAAADTTGRLIIQIGSIQLQRVGSGTLAHHIEAGGPRHGMHPQRVSLHRGIEQGEVKEVALIDRQSLDLGGIHVGVNRDRVGIHSFAGGCGHGDLFARGRRPQRELQDRLVSQQDCYRRLLRFKAVQSDRNDVVSGRQGLESTPHQKML